MDHIQEGNKAVCCSGQYSADPWTPGMHVERQNRFGPSRKQSSLMSVASLGRILLPATKQNWFRNGLKSLKMSLRC